MERMLAAADGNHVSYYWTLTIQKNVQIKAEAEAIFKPLRDLIKRKGGTIAGVWEKQERGSWHCHFLTNVYLDVNHLRPWLVERGWGPQMFVKRVQVAMHPDGQGRWVADVSSVKRLVRYLGKYITKTLAGANGEKSTRVFFASADARIGSVRFSWMPEVNPYAYLYYYGRALFFVLNGRQPSFKEVKDVIRLGVEDTDWASIDPWFDSS